MLFMSVVMAACSSDAPDVSEPRDTPTPRGSVSAASPTEEPDDTRREGVSEDAVLTVEGLGEMKIGMTVAEIEVATGEKVRVSSDFYPGCRYASLGDGTPKGVGLMLSHRRLVRLDIWSDATTLTDTGVGLGDSESKVRRKYGDEVVVSDHPYLGSRGSYMEYRPPGEDRLLMLFETDKGQVTSFRTGYAQQVRYIEGCA